MTAFTVDVRAIDIHGINHIIKNIDKFVTSPATRIVVYGSSPYLAMGKWTDMPADVKLEYEQAHNDMFDITLGIEQVCDVNKDVEEAIKQRLYEKWRRQV